MDEMMNVVSIYGPPDPRPAQNPYAALQAASGVQLSANGPTTTPDPSAYGDNDPRYYTDLRANLNNQGPPVMYRPVPPGSGAGVSPMPSQFTPSYYLRVFNRGDKSVRVSQGCFNPSGFPEFPSPRNVDDSLLLEYPQASPGDKYPILVELPSKKILFKILSIPSGQNQLVFYVPFESELQDRRAPSANVGNITVYAENQQELVLICKYLGQFNKNAAVPKVAQPQPAISPDLTQRLAAQGQSFAQATAQQQFLAQQQQAVAQQASRQAAVQSNVAQQQQVAAVAAQQQAAAQQQTAQRAAAQQQAAIAAQQQAAIVAQQQAAQRAAAAVAAQQQAAQKAAQPKEESMIPSMLMLLGGAIATHYINKFTGDE
jgi:hypothetical protein